MRAATVKNTGYVVLNVPDYTEVKSLAMLRAGRKLIPLRLSVQKLFDLLDRRGIQGFGGFQGEDLAAAILPSLESEFRAKYSIPDGEVLYVYMGDKSPDEFHYLLADEFIQKFGGEASADSVLPILVDVYAPHVFRPHLEVSHLYAR